MLLIFAIVFICSWKNSTVETSVASSINPSQQELCSSFRKLSSQDELLNNYSHTSATDNTIKLNGSLMNSEIPSMTGRIPSYPQEKMTTDFGSILSHQKIPTYKSYIDGNKDGITSQAHHHHHHEHSERSAHHNKSTSEAKNCGNMNTNNHVKSSLFIYSLGSMRLLLLLEQDRCFDPELIQTLVIYILYCFLS